MFRGRPASIFVRLAGLGALLLVCAQTACGAGVTVIVHGYRDESETWISSMAYAMEDRVAGPASVAMYTLVIKSRWEWGWLGPQQIIYVDSFTRDVGSPSIRDNGEVIVKVNWADVDEGVCGFNVVPTTIIGELVAEALTLPNAATDGMLNHRLCELPIHLIGHSRGGSVVAETARILGSSGIWVDHLTTLDPHPLFCGDAPVNVYETVLFADNYYQLEDAWPFPNGTAVFGAYNRHLPYLAGGYGRNHADVHLWYHGTIDLSASASDSLYVITTDMRQTWWPGETQGATAGFYYTRLGGGLNDRPTTGISWQHRGPGPWAINRISSQRQGAQWANISAVDVPSHSLHIIQIGDQVTFSCRYQDQDSGAIISWSLDTDRNPYNTPLLTLVWSNTVSSTGGDVVSGSFSHSSSGVSAGTYFLCAEITSDNGSYTRYDYAPGSITFTATPVIIPTPAITSLDPDMLPGQPLPQTQLLKILGNNFLTNSQLEFFDGTTTYPGRVPIYVSPTELRYNIKVGNVSANWTVKVRNGTNVSAPAAFTVVATADTTAPPAPIGLTASYVGGLSNDFYYVDWTNPSDSSGITKVWFKLGSTPTSPTDGLGLDVPLFQPLPVATLSTNPQTIYVWLEDGQGNKDQNNRSSLLLYRTTGPITILTPPQNRTVVEGASAVFSVVASGSQPLSYQWRRSDDGGSSFTNVPGAADSTYVTPAVTLADNGAEFTIRITNFFGAITSAPETLTVTNGNVITWVGGYSGGWTNSTNWNPRIVPTSSHIVFITNGSVTVPTNATFAVLSVTNAQLTGSLTASGTVNWAGGWLSGSVTIGTGTVVNIMGTQNKNLAGGCVVSNFGIVVWTGGGDLEFGYDAVWHNLAGSVFELQNDASFVWNCTLPPPLCLLTAPPLLQFQNAGIFRKIRSNGTSRIGYTQFSNSGRVELESGALQFQGGGRAFSSTLTSAGPMQVAAGASVILAGGSYQFNPGHSFIGAGSVQAVGGILMGTIDSGDFRLSPGGDISGTFTNIGKINWTGGYFYGVTMKNWGLLDISGDSNKSLEGTFVNSGRTTWSGASDISGNHVLFQNLEGALFEIQNNQTFLDLSGSGYLDNAGLLLKSGGAGLTTFDGFAVSNRGTILVQRGSISFTEGYAQSAAGSLDIYLASSNQFAQVATGGPASFDGALNVTLMAGFQPTDGESFPMVSYASRSGQFGNVIAGPLPAGLTLSPNYTATALELVTTDVRPRLGSAAVLPTGEFVFRLTGLPGQNYAIQASTNLVDWLTLILTNTPSGIFDFVDPVSANVSQRFYRTWAQ